jgi:hypothetical protein
VRDICHRPPCLDRMPGIPVRAVHRLCHDSR